MKNRPKGGEIGPRVRLVVGSVKSRGRGVREMRKIKVGSEIK